MINDLPKKVIKLYNKRSGKTIRFEDLTTYDFRDCLPVEDAEGIVALFKDKELWDSLKPVTGSQIGIQTLMELGHRVIFATATDPCNFEWKIEWLKIHFPFVDSKDVIRIHNKGLLNVDVLIDDHLDNLMSNICERICFDYPYNRDEDMDYIYSIFRAKSWKDIVKYINDLERKNKEYE